MDSLNTTTNQAFNGGDNPNSLPPVIVPPYWQHNRQASRASVISNGKPPPITLEDNTEEPEGIKSPLWAKLVTIESHTIVSGNVKGVGDYVVWMCRVETLDVGGACFLYYVSNEWVVVLMLRSRRGAVW